MKPSKCLDAFLRRLKGTQIKDSYASDSNGSPFTPLQYSRNPYPHPRSSKMPRERMKDILFSLADAGRASLLHV
jgi:hypothetical protein